MELEKVAERFTDIIEGAGPLGMPGELGALPGGQFAVELMFDLGEFHPQFADFVLSARFRRPDGCEFFDLLFDFADRLFKIKVIAHSASVDSIPEGIRPSPRCATIPETWPLCLALPQHLRQSRSLGVTVRWGRGAVSLPVLLSSPTAKERSWRPGDV